VKVEDKIMYNLKPVDSHVSFYGKAKVYDVNGYHVLRSYDTMVAYIDSYDHFYRTWGGYSATTMRHVNSFLVYHGLPSINKKMWLDMLVVSRVD
jgi:hypothetical protein